MTTSTPAPDSRRAITVLSTLVGLVLATLTATAVLSYRTFARLVQLDVDALFARSRPDREVIVTEEMVRHLPGPVQRYLQYTGVLGTPMTHTIHLQQRGKMRPNGQGPWMPFDAEQVYTVQPPGFVWDGTLRLGPVPIGRARDMYREGTGTMLIKLGALVTIADVVGEEIDQAAMMRYFSEMVWFPTSFLGDNVSFSPIDDHSVLATFSDHGRSVSATLQFDDDGRLTEFLAERYRMVGDRNELTTWSTPVTGYGEFEGLQLPIKAKAVWRLPEGDLEYIDISVTGLEYNRLHATRGGTSDAPIDRDPAERSAAMRLFYRDWHPTRLGRWVNQVQGWYAGLGLPPHVQAVLEVPGRTSGRTRSNPVVIVTVDGVRYLVSMLGPASDWVKNVEAAHGDAVIRHGRRHHVHLVLVDPGQRAPILREYVRIASSGRQHFPVSEGAPESEYEAIAERYPVFRIDPA